MRNKMETKKVAITIFFLVLISPVFSFQESQEKYVLEYRIGPRDLLDITVFGNEELSRRVRVSEDGKITLPPLKGEIEVGGLTKVELEDKLNQLLGEDLLQNPQVTVFILEYRSKRVALLGAVLNPGFYELIGRQKLLHIIAEAGGFSTVARGEITIMRERQDGLNETLKISIKDLISGDAALNIPLEPNDTIYVLPEETVAIYVIGAVRNPGALEVGKSEIPTLYRAIAMAGGFIERASKGGVIVRRMDESGKERPIKVNVKDIINGKKQDFPLQENDIVFVPETIF